MATVEVVDTESNKPAGTISIPDDVLAAAAKVYAWMSEHRAIELHGLRLADND